MSPKLLKIFIFSCDSAGHIYPCIGIAQALAKRGHHIKLLINEAFVAEFSKFGFEMIVLKRAEPEIENGKLKNPIKGMSEHLIETGVFSGLSPLENLKRNADQTSFMKRFYDSSVDYDGQLEAAFEVEKPDLMVIDHFLIPPALNKSGIPYVFLSSGNPMSLYGSAKLPPSGAGFPTNSDPETWTEYRELAIARMKVPFGKYQKDLNEHFGYDPEKDPNSKTKRQTLYGYPLELDYHDVAPVPDNCIRVDAFCFEIPEPFELPVGFVQPGDKLVYLSLGSMCSVDVKLMKKIVSALSKTKHKCIVSKGHKADEYELPANCWGKPFLPQTAILPLVDLVITHGGNNTLTETFSFGKPMIVMPVFADQHDNAQRIQENGFGEHIETYNFTEEQLTDCVNRLVADEELKARCRAAAERIANANSKDLACVKIEEFVENYSKVKQ